MSEFKRKIKYYLSNKERISKEKYIEMTRHLSEKEIEDNFECIPESYRYYETYFLIKSSPNEEEYNEALLFELCKKQDETNNLLTSIKKMLTFFTVMMILSMIFGFIGFCVACSSL